LQLLTTALTFLMLDQLTV